MKDRDDQPTAANASSHQQHHSTMNDIEQMLVYYKKLVEHKEQDVASLEKAMRAQADEQQKLQVALQAATNAQQAATMACAHKERQLAAETAARRADVDATAAHAAKVPQRGHRLMYLHTTLSHSWSMHCMRCIVPRRSSLQMHRRWRPSCARASSKGKHCRTSTWHWGSAWNRCMGR